jgi:ribosomal protein S18 acetylase RimI-like enzyme
MLELRLSVELASPADRVWEVTGNFNGMPDWHPWVASSALEAAPGGIGRRIVNVGGSAGRRELSERLVFFDGAAREYAYTIIAGPAPFTDYVGRFRVVPRGADRCAFEYLGRYRAAPGKTDAEATERIQTFYQAGLANLAQLFGRVPATPRADPPSVALTLMRPEAFAAFVDAAVEDYAADNVAVGRWPAADARALSRAEFERLLPQGLATADNFLFEITELSATAIVGMIWITVVTRGNSKTAFVYQVRVEPEFRRRGYATAALRALEDIARELGASSIGLHVFEHNPGAQALYRSLGYAVTGTNMLKPLDGGG